MERFIKKNMTRKNDNINRLYLGYKKMGWRRNDFFINIGDYPSIMVAGKDEGILKTILNLIRFNIDNRAFDSEIITTIYSEKANVKNKYYNFKNVCDNKSVESVLLALKQEVNQRLKDFEMTGSMNITQFNERSQQSMTRRVMIIDGFEEVMDNIIVLGLYKELITRMRMVGITLIAVVNTDKLIQSKRSSLLRQLSEVQNQMIQHFPCKIMTHTYEKFETLPYDTQKLKNDQMVIEYGKYKRENGLLGESISDVLQIPKIPI